MKYKLITLVVNMNIILYGYLRDCAVGIKYNLFYGNGEMEFVPVLKTFTEDENMVRLISNDNALYATYRYLHTR